MGIAQRDENATGASELDLGYYGWRVVLAACLGVMAGFGSLFVYTFSVFVKPLAAEFGWSREAISSGFAIAAITLGLCSPLLGRWIDRFGPRRIILTCMTIFACAIGSLSLLHSGLWQFYVTCFVLGVVGNGAAHLAYSRSISTWFQRRLGMALACVMVGAGLGAMILPVVAQSIISRSGWRAAYAALGCLALLLGLPLSWRYIRERGMMGQESAPVPHPGMTWQHGLRSSAFWIVPSALQWYAEGFAERSAIKVDLQIDSDFGRLPAAMEIALFRVVQECLTNIHKHSGSSSASIRVNRKSERIDLEISDSGKGISPDRFHEGKVVSGVGMMGMRERMRQFGGSMEVTSSRDGTAVIAWIPLKN